MVSMGLFKSANDGQKGIVVLLSMFCRRVDVQKKKEY